VDDVGPRGSGTEPYLSQAFIFGRNVTALAAMRSFGAASIPLRVFGAAGTFAARSRYYRRHPAVAGKDLAEAQLATFLESLGGESAVLFPCSDDWLKAVAALSPALRQRFPSSLPSPETIADFADKLRFAGVMQRLGLPHPRTRLISSAAEIEALSDDAFPRSFLKPANSQAFARAYSAKAFRPTSRAEAAASWQTAHDAGHVMLFQEYIQGPPDEHYFVDGFIDRHATPRAVLARRRVRMDPPDLGNSSQIVSVAPAQIRPAIDDALRLLRAMSYRGIFSVEFKHDREDGLYKFLEVNARPWWYLAFAAHCGMDVARMAYADALEQEVATIAAYRVGERCTYLLPDFKAAQRAIRAGELSYGAWLRSLRGTSWPVFEWRDPAPAVAMPLLAALGYLRSTPGHER
jgi:D-aspartate ligase